eukprot:CCRYP_008691-RA/>CCRYP_008691-RA protein AED:0.13 eAED:0.13 QI:0/-1/0/1/-1/1/1/0/247
MTKHTSMEDYLRIKSMFDTRTVLHAPSSSEQTIQTAPGRLEDHSVEESIDTSELDQQDIERIRKEDPFMYYSIVQHARKMRSSGFVSHMDGVGEALGSPVPSPADTAAGHPNPGIRRGAAFLDNSNNRGPPFQASNTRSSRTEEQKLVSSFAHQRHPVSSSFQHVSSSVPSQGLTPYPSFPGYPVGVVTRKRRISVEADYTKEMVDLIASFSGHLNNPLNESASTLESDDNSDIDLGGLDLSSLELE